MTQFIACPDGAFKTFPNEFSLYLIL